MHTASVLAGDPAQKTLASLRAQVTCSDAALLDMQQRLARAEEQADLAKQAAAGVLRLEHPDVLLCLSACAATLPGGCTYQPIV